MAYSLPVIASDIDPMPEFGGDAVAYFDAFSPDDLAGRIVELLSDREQARELGSQAKERSEMYSWDAFTQKVIDLCNRCGAV